MNKRILILALKSIIISALYVTILVYFIRTDFPPEDLNIDVQHPCALNGHWPIDAPPCITK